MNELIIAEKAELTAIADAIREKSGSVDTYSLAEMVAAIGEIEGGVNVERYQGEITTALGGCTELGTVIAKYLGEVTIKASDRTES
jgi:hypothetical protein